MNQEIGLGKEARKIHALIEESEKLHDERLLPQVHDALISLYDRLIVDKHSYSASKISELRRKLERLITIGKEADELTEEHGDGTLAAGLPGLIPAWSWEEDHTDEDTQHMLHLKIKDDAQVNGGELYVDETTARRLVMGLQKLIANEGPRSMKLPMGMDSEDETLRTLDIYILDFVAPAETEDDGTTDAN